MAALLALGVRVWPGVWLGALLANLWDYFAAPSQAPLGTHFGVSFGIAAGSTLQALAGAALLRRLSPDGSVLDSARRVFLFVGVTLSVCLIAASFGAAGLWLSGLVPAPAVGTVWWTWWLGDATGILLIAPLLLAWGLGGRSASERGTRGEAAGVLALTAVVGLMVFGGTEFGTGSSPLAYLTIPLLVWAAVRFGPRGATASLVLVSGLAVWGTASGFGPFVRSGLYESLLLLQVFMGVVAMTALVLAASLTERQRAADALRASEERLRILTEALPHMVWTMRPDATVEFANGRTTEFLGRSARELDARGWGDLIHPEDRTGARSAMVGAFTRGEAFEVEYRVRHHSGAYRWVVSRAVPLRGGANEVAKWIGSSDDTHDKKLAEEGLRQLNATLEQRVAERTRALEANEALLRQFVSHAPAAIAMLDTELRYLRVSDRWLTDYHLGDTDVIGRSHYEVFPDIPDRWKEIHRRVLAGAIEACNEDSFPRADGTREWLQWEARPWYGAGGEIGGVIFFTQVITARKRAEAELRENRERLEMALSASRMGVWEWDVGTGAIYWSPECHEIVGHGPFDGTLSSFTERIHPDDKDRVWASVQAALTGRTGYTAEFRLVLPDGETRWVSNIGRATYDDSGAPVRMVGLVQDITARKRTEAALRESEERFRTAFESAPIGMALVSPDGRWLRVNRSVCEIVGYPEAELLATDFQALTHPDDLNSDLASVRSVLAGTIQTYQMEKRYLHKQGHVVHILLAVSLVRDTAGQPLYFISQIQDITERKTIEAALRESEERFRLLVEGITDYAVFMLDTEGRVASWNQGAERIKGYAAEEVLGRHFSIFYTPGAVARGHPDHELATALATGRYTEDGPRLRKGGSLFWASIAITSLRDQTGRHIGFVKVTRDVTERRAAEEHLAASLREKELLLKEIHQRVKNNLQIVSTLLDLQSGHTTDPEALVMFQESRGRVRSMALIHERLYRSHDMARVNFAEYVRQLADDLYHSYRLSDDAIRLAIDVSIPPLPIDIAIPCGLLLNELMSNCFKHAFKDQPGGEIRVFLGQGPGDERTNVLVVSDNGRGFPAGLDFRDTPSFGLQLVNTLVDQLGGGLALTAEGGTTFTVRFPRPGTDR